MQNIKITVSFSDCEPQIKDIGTLSYPIEKL